MPSRRSQFYRWGATTSTILMVSCTSTRKTVTSNAVRINRFCFGCPRRIFATGKPTNTLQVFVPTGVSTEVPVQRTGLRAAR